MGFWAIGLCVLAIVAARQAVTKLRSLGRLVSEAHLREVASSVPSLLKAALSEPGTPPHPPRDARTVVTSEGVALFLTVHAIAEREVLLVHLSLSRRGGFIPWAAAGRLAFMLLHQLGVPPERAACSHGRMGVAHVMFTVPIAEAEHRHIVGELPMDVTTLLRLATEFVHATVRSGELVREERVLAESVLRAT